MGNAGNTRAATVALGVALGFADPRWDGRGEAEAKLVAVEKDDGEEEHERHEDYEAEWHLKRQFGSRYYTLVRGKWDRRPRSDLSSEVHVGPGIGIHLARSDQLSFQLDAGLAYNDERHHAVGRDIRYSSVFAQATLGWSLESEASITWTGHVKFGSGRASALKADQEIDVDAPLSHRLSLQVAVEWEHDSHPSEGLGRNDYSLTVSLAVKPWGN